MSERCDDCGEFAQSEEVDTGCVTSLDEAGNVNEDWWTTHKEGYGCKRAGENND